MLLLKGLRGRKGLCLCSMVIGCFFFDYLETPGSPGIALATLSTLSTLSTLDLLLP